MFISFLDLVLVPGPQDLEQPPQDPQELHLHEASTMSIKHRDPASNITTLCANILQATSL